MGVSKQMCILWDQTHSQVYLEGRGTGSASIYFYEILEDSRERMYLWVVRVKEAIFKHAFSQMILQSRSPRFLSKMWDK